MAWYGPLELRDESGQPTGKFHYTCSNSAGTYAIGNCAPNDYCKTCEKNHDYPAAANCPECNGAGLIPKANPCPGHDTPIEATKHYHEYLADTATWHEKTNEWPKEKCDTAGCQNEGRTYAWTQGRIHDALFCADHKTRDALFAHLQAPYDKAADKA